MSTSAATGVSTNPDTAAAVSEALSQARVSLAGQAPALGILFASPKHDLQAALCAAQKVGGGAPFVGSTTAGEITERGLVHGGVALMLLASDEMLLDVSLARGVKGDTTRAAAELSRGFAEAAQAASEKGFVASSTILLADGLNGAGEGLVNELLGATRRFQQVVGGAAGDEGAFKATHVGAIGEAVTDGAVALHCFGAKPWGIGVDHGLRPTTDKLRVTRAEKNVVYELDGRPAFDVYREHAKKRGVSLEPESAGSFLIGNELGIYFFEQLHRARAPLSVGAAGELVCAGEIPQGASVCILDGEPDSMVAAAGRAAEQARKGLVGEKAAAVLLFDCVCRGMILNGQFGREVEAVRAVFPGVPVAGFLTYGEIARFKGHMDGWHNTAAVVTAIPA
jgi:methyl-accepting chemotaxis protein